MLVIEIEIAMVLVVEERLLEEPELGLGLGPGRLLQPLLALVLMAVLERILMILIVVVAVVVVADRDHPPAPS